MQPRILMIDNYDSFTWNLVALLKESGASVEVCRNDDITPEAALAFQPSGVVISPGPGRPAEAGAAPAVLRTMWGVTSILGVCLGHQMIAEAAGARVVYAPYPVHGKTTSLQHDGKEIFAGLPQGMQVMRYHSLVVSSVGLPDTLRITAKTSDGLIMALAVNHKPIWSVQFHPESIMTVRGATIIKNWLNTAKRWN